MTPAHPPADVHHFNIKQKLKKETLLKYLINVTHCDLVARIYTHCVRAPINHTKAESTNKRYSLCMSSGDGVVDSTLDYQIQGSQDQSPASPVFWMRL